MALRLGTFNVWGLPEIFGVADDVSSRMRLIAERLSDASLDVLLIQEAWTDEVRETLTAGARAAGFAVAPSPAGSGGLMTLSRRPILSAGFRRFRFRGDPERLDLGEYLGGKGFETVRLDVGGRPLTLVNTHLHARYRRARPRLNSAVRMAQLLQIVGAIHGLDETVVVGGDLNCSPGDPEYSVFEALSGASELGGGGAHPTLSRMNWYKRHRKGQDKRIDFLFVRTAPGTTWSASDARLLFAEPARIRAIDRSLSDHFGFRATLRLDAAPSLVAARAPLDPAALRLAHELLDVGRREADRRERAHFQLAGLWVAAAAASSLVRRTPAVDRRRFLRMGADAFAVAALGPAVGFGALARVDSDVKRDAFDDARQVLAELDADPSGRSA